MGYLIFMVLMAVALATSLTKWKLVKAKRDTPEDLDSEEVKARTERILFLESKGSYSRTQREDLELEKLHREGGETTNPVTRLFESPTTWLVSAAASATLFLTLTIMTSLVIVKENTTAHFERVWGGSALHAGEIVSRLPMQIFGGGKGPQSQNLRPGTYFIFLQNVLYDRATSDKEKMLKVPAGQFALLVAKDGEPMVGGRMLAAEWGAGEFTNMLEDATYFLNNGGMKGMQYTVIPSGNYHINSYLWDLVSYVNETKVGTGEEAVIRSNIQLDGVEDCTPLDATTKVPLVPKGCRGVWAEGLKQGTYRFNPKAVSSTIISVRQSTNDHHGNYTRKLISFSTDDEGNIVPYLKDEAVPQGKSIDDAIDLRAEGWNIDQDVSVFWQISDAPRAVAQLGGSAAIAQFVARVTQSEFRIIAQGKDSSLCVKKGATYKACMVEARQAMDLVYRRGEIEDAARAAIHSEIMDYGLGINKVTMGRPNIPPELLMPALRTQYAEKMLTTLTQEEQTAQKRIAVKNANELANNQGILVRADLADQAATKEAARIIKLASAREKAAKKEASGQRALLNVMGADKVQEQILIQKILDMAIECPTCIKVPHINVQSGGGSLEGAAAILGAGSNLSNMVRSTSPK